MELFSLAGSKSAASVEALLTELSLANVPRDFRLPTKLQSREFGGMATFAQACATWAHKFPNSALRTYVSDDEPDRDLSNLLGADHGIVGVALAGEVKDRAGIDITWAAKRAELARLQQLQKIETSKRGMKLMIVAADDTSFVSPAALYSSASPGGGTLRTEAGFILLAKQILEATSLGVDAERLTPMVVPLGSLLYELVRNSHEHARTEVDGSAIRRSVRFLRAEGVWHNSQSDLLGKAKGDEGLTRYLNATAGRDKSKYLELTIWDSGPGLAARRLNDLGFEHPSVEEEWSASIDCFEKHLTTSRNGARGLGLERVQMALTNLRGLLRLRTGRILLERDYVNQPHRPGSRAEFGQPHALAPVRGTSMTLLFPTSEQAR